MSAMAGHDHVHGTHVYTSRDAVEAVVISAVVLGAAATVNMTEDARWELGMV